MRLDASALRYMTRDDFRVLTAVEMGMKNHELVPVELIVQIAGLRLGGTNKFLSTLLRYKLLHHDRSTYDAYRLTYLGYDYLCLRTLLVRGVVAGVGRQIGVGKESDIFIVVNDDEEELCLKMHRLGRTSFRAVKNKRDYHKNRGSPSWLYLSRLAAVKEFTFMKVLFENGFPVPVPVDCNRHGIVMKLIDGFPLNQVKNLDNPAVVYTEMMDLIDRFARHGLIHGDFNEFNVMISETGQLTVIDFPQMVSINHPNARMYFERDVNCVRRFFRKRFNFVADMKPDFDEAFTNRVKDLDVIVAASGFTNQMAKEFDQLVEQQNGGGAENEENDQGEADEDDDDEEEEEDETTEEQQEQQENDAEEQEPGVTNQVQEEDSFVRLPKDVEIDEQQAQNDNDDGEDDESQEEEEETANQKGDDAPDAYLAYDYATQPVQQPRVDDIRRKVQRDFNRKAKRNQKRGKTSRNIVKSKDKRRLKQDLNDQM